jgi:hypothetical protein
VCFFVAQRSVSSKSAYAEVRARRGGAKKGTNATKVYAE